MYIIVRIIRSLFEFDLFLIVATIFIFFWIDFLGTAARDNGNVQFTFFLVMRSRTAIENCNSTCLRMALKVLWKSYAYFIGKMHCSFWHFKYTSHCSNSFIISGKIKKHFGCYYNISSTLEYYWLDNNILIIFGMPLHYLLFQFLPPLNTRFLKKFWAEKKKAIEEVPRRKGFFTFLLIQF